MDKVTLSDLSEKNALLLKMYEMLVLAGQMRVPLQLHQHSGIIQIMYQNPDNQKMLVVDFVPDGSKISKVKLVSDTLVNYQEFPESIKEAFAWLEE